jgi:hypothetical protein
MLETIVISVISTVVIVPAVIRAQDVLNDRNSGDLRIGPLGRLASASRSLMSSARLQLHRR